MSFDLKNSLRFLERPLRSARHQADIDEIGGAMLAKGYLASAADIEWAWYSYSDGWLPIDDHGAAADIVIERLQ